MIEHIIPEHLSNLMTGVAVIGFGLASLAADPRARTTQMLCLGLVMQGLTMSTATLKFVYLEGEIPWWARMLALTEATAFASWLQWILMVAKSNRPSPRSLRWVIVCTRSVQGLAVVYLLAALYMPHERLRFMGLGDAAALMRWPISLLAGLWLLMVAISMLPASILLTQKIDPAERARLYGLLAAVPLMILSPFLTPDWSAFSMLVGLIVFAFGALQYHVAQGRRGLFMRRFLSPAVADLVARRGLDHTMRPAMLEVTVVSCDLRGFTRYSRRTESTMVVQLIGEYYDIVGKQVARFGATIKDYAGDGVLILVGAPLPVANSASDGLALACGIRDAVGAFLRRWQREDAGLGIGVGVATGRITVGALGSESRLEYMAIGDAVNLAARFASLASDGEIWVDQRTQQLSAHAAPAVSGVAQVKGMGEVDYFRYRSVDGPMASLPEAVMPVLR